MLISVILPARNEEVLMEKTLKDISLFLRKRGIVDYEILVVVNGTTDKTPEIVQDFGLKDTNVKLLESEPGYGKALKLGLSVAKGKYVVIFNVDFYDLIMIDLINVDLCHKDIIIGSKMTHWSVDRRPWFRKLVSYVFNLYLRFAFCFKGSDTHGIKILRRKVIRKILPACKTDGGIFDTEFVLRAQYAGFSFMDLPVYISERRSPRFSNRFWQTPRDIFDLYKALSNLRNRC